MPEGGISAQQLERLFAWAVDDPLRFYRPTAPGLAMLQDDTDVCLLRGPNQAGKSMALAADLLDFMLGRGQWDADRPKRHSPPVDVWVVSPDNGPSVTLQKRILALCPPGELKPDTTFSKRGFGAAKLELANGSTCTFKTHNQSLDSATLSAIFLDEPPPEHIWDALIARVNQLRGSIRIYLCPQDGGGRFLRKKVEGGTISEHHFRLSVANCWPVGAFRPFKEQDQIDAFVRDLRPSQVPQRAWGEWEGPPEDAFFPDFNKATHVRAHRPTGRFWKLAVGVDYGPAIGKPAVALVAVRDGQSVAPTIVFLGEAKCPADTRWSVVEIAQAIKAILDAQGLHPRDIDAWAGDRPAQSPNHGRQSNAALWSMLSQLYSLPPTASPFRVPKKRTGIVRASCELINHAFATSRAWLLPGLPCLINFFELFDGDEHHSTKDIGDAARYAVMSLVHFRWYDPKPRPTDASAT